MWTVYLKILLECFCYALYLTNVCSAVDSPVPPQCFHCGCNSLCRQQRALKITNSSIKLLCYTVIILMTSIISMLSCIPHIRPALQLKLIMIMMTVGAACVCGGRRALSSATLQSGLLLQLHSQPAVREAQLLQWSGHVGSLRCWGRKQQWHTVIQLSQYHHPGTISTPHTHTGTASHTRMRKVVWLIILL